MRRPFSERQKHLRPTRVCLPANASGLSAMMTSHALPLAASKLNDGAQLMHLYRSKTHFPTPQANVLTCRTNFDTGLGTPCR
jgi:hypothetical protein